MTVATPYPMEWIHDQVLRAESRIRPWIRRTYLEPSPFLAEVSGCEVHLKLENLQITGSFKLRGAFNKILSLGPEEAARGVVTASSGNHGMATAHALKAAGRSGVIYLPETVSRAKLIALRRMGANCQLTGRESGEAEMVARKVAESEGKVYVSPYNDPQVIAGQGTIGIELDEDLPELEAVLIAVGGGGLISGVASFLKTRRPDVLVIGCLPENSPVMYESVRQGRIIDCPNLPTLSDGTAGSIEEGSITFNLCRELIDDYILVSEGEIAAAMRLLADEHRLLVEGSAAVSVAAFLKQKQRFEGRQVVLLLCGGNVDAETIRRVIC